MDLPPGTKHFNVPNVPSDQEIPAISYAIPTGEEGLKKNEGRMEELRQELRALEEPQEMQEREANRQKNLISPIQRVNVDVLTSIFLSVLDMLDSNDLWIAAKGHPTIFLDISHVCQCWREVALATKVLWRHLHIMVPCYPRSSSEQETWRVKVVNLLQLTRLWISRSEPYHLSVIVSDGDTMLFDSPVEVRAFVTECVEFNELVEVICSSSTRWKDLYIFIGYPQGQLLNFPTPRLLTVPPQSTPVLTTVRLACDLFQDQEDNPLNEHMASRMNIFSAPTLRSLRIGRQVLVGDLMHMPVVWSNLEHFSFGGDSLCRCDAEQALALFEECPNLVTCYLAIQRCVIVPIDRAPVRLQRLRELAITPQISHLPKGFARFLTLPSLRKLELLKSRGECTPREYQESGLSEFIERFRPTLEDVTICFKYLTQTGLQDCLGHLPNITSLRLVGSRFSIPRIAWDAEAAKLNSDIFKLLSPQFDETGTTVTQLPLCPRIEVFRFGAVKGEVTEEALIDFIEARRREIDDRSLQGGVARLREVDSSYYEFQATDFKEALRSRGVDMEGFSLTKRDRSL